jgi:hypothetical protein
MKEKPSVVLAQLAVGETPLRLGGLWFFVCFVPFVAIIAMKG